MITNERQYKISKVQADKFKSAIDNCNVEKSIANGVHPILAEAQIEQFRSEHENILKQIEEYERLVSGDETDFEAKSLQELPLVLIKARIARNWTQKKLAEALGLKEQQIQRYEADFYRSASFKTLERIANALDLKLSKESMLYSISDSLIGFSKKVPFREMFKRGWFDDYAGTIVDAVKNSNELIENLFIHAGVTENQIALHRKKLRINSDLNEYSLTAWQARILSLSQRQQLYQDFDVNRLTDEWFRELAKLSQFNDGPLLAKNWLLENGIYFVIEPHLPQTYLDGAAIKNKDGNPIVAMTLRHDRLDNFWFVLFHELAHIKLHFSADDYCDFFDDIEIASNDIEIEADNFALNALIPSDSWDRCLSRFTQDVEVIREEAKQLQIHPAILAGRIRSEQNNYTILNDAIGHKEVRKCFTGNAYDYDLFY